MDCHRYKLIRFKEFKTKLQGLYYIFDILFIYLSNLSFAYNTSLITPVLLITPVTLGGRAFCYAAPKLWNNLPSEISSLDSLSNFKCHVKTYLLKQAFNLQQCICFVYFIIYHLLFSYFIFKSFYLLVNFIHFQSFFLTYCKRI